MREKVLWTPPSLTLGFGARQGVKKTMVACVWVRDGSAPALENNICGRNPADGIHMEPGASPALRNNETPQGHSRGTHDGRLGSQN